MLGSSIVTKSPTEPKTAFVLAGGGSLGAVQVGMLCELIRDGIIPDLIVGVSAGALNGAFLAFDPCVDNVERMASLWCRMTTREVLGLSWRSLLGLVGFQNHVASPTGLKSLLQRELGATRIFFLPRGFACAQNRVPRHALGRAMHAITLLGARQLRHDFEHYSRSLIMRIAPPLCPLSQSSYNYSNGAELIAQARASTRSWIDAGGLDRGDFPNQLTMHSHGGTATNLALLQ